MQYAHLPCAENFSPPNGHLGQSKICVFLNRPNFFRPANEPCHFHCNIGLGTVKPQISSQFTQ